MDTSGQGMEVGERSGAALGPGSADVRFVEVALREVYVYFNGLLITHLKQEVKEKI